MMTLIEAIKKNNQTEFFRLLNLKTDPSGKRVIDEIDAENGGNALHIAVACGHIHFVIPLIEAGIDVNEPDNDGWTPVYIAADNGYAEIITTLKAAGADMDKPNSDDVTPIYVATENEHTAAIIALGAAGAKIDTLDNNGFTPLCMAVKVGDVAVVSALLEAGANANVKTPRGTPLEGAQKGTGPGHPEVVRLLETHLKQYPNGIMTRNINMVATHSGSRTDAKEQSEISGQKLQATLPHSRNTTEFNPPRTDDNSAPKVVIVHSGSKPQADENLQKFSAVINGQDDYWIEQNHHKGLPKGIQALQKAMNAQNYSLGALIAEAKKWRKPTFLYKPEPCLQALYQIFLDAEQGKSTEVRQGLSALTRAQRQYQQSTELKTKLQTNQMHLEQALSAKNNLMIAEAYQERGLLYLDTDKIRYSPEALESFSQALTLEASASLTAFCLRKRASLYLAQGKTIASVCLISVCATGPSRSTLSTLDLGTSLRRRTPSASPSAAHVIHSCSQARLNAFSYGSTPCSIFFARTHRLQIRFAKNSTATS